MQNRAMIIRHILQTDNQYLAEIIRSTLAEFGANHPGTVYFDSSIDSLFELFRKLGSVYYVVENEDGKIVGGGGIFPTEGLPPDTCELVKMYLIPEVRGTGLGKSIIEKCMHSAYGYGYRKVYMETMPELKLALKVYEKFGFHYLDHPIGNSGHFGCDLHMIREL